MIDPAGIVLLVGFTVIYGLGVATADSVKARWQGIQGRLGRKRKVTPPPNSMIIYPDWQRPNHHIDVKPTTTGKRS